MNAENLADAIFVGRLYGAVLLSFGLLFRTILLQRETRSELATLLLSVAVFNLLQIIGERSIQCGTIIKITAVLQK